ncbi:MAG TPA: hypothetical protein VFT50_14625 [Baekduia sp.]|nr:hypothetical protein [Baekduia sp.]
MPTASPRRPRAVLERLTARGHAHEDDVTGPPDFVGVGTLNSGTQWWHSLLLRHPDIVGPRDRRELHFFEQFCTREMTDADIAAYHAAFPRPRGKLAGEWTPRYAYDVWAPGLLKRAAPDAKLLLLVSDPLERYRDRLEQGPEEGDEAGDEQIFMADASARGRYAVQLQNLLRSFDREQILVLQQEQCLRDPAGQYVRTLRFLGVRDDVLPVNLRALTGDRGAQAYVAVRRRLGLARRRLRGRTPPATIRPELWPDIELALRTDLESDVGELCALVPDIDLTLWPAFAHLAGAAAR